MAICTACRDKHHEKCPDYKTKSMPTKCFCLHRPIKERTDGER